MTGPAPFLVPAGTAVLSGELTPHLAERRGIVLIRTPYDARAHRPMAASLARRGWDCLVQDVRGRHASTGAWMPYAHEAADGVATIAALRAAGHDGPLVLLGASYAAHTALEAARVVGAGEVDAVVALVPALGLYETAYDVHRRPQHRDRLGWWSRHGFTRHDAPPLGAAALDTATRVAETVGAFAAARWLGWDEVRMGAWHRLWTADPLDLTARYGGLGMPLLIVTGDHDPFDGQARRLADATTRGPGPVAAVLSGPWGHDLRVRGASPGAHVLDWLAGRGTTSGVERRLDATLGAWLDRALATEGAA